MEAELRRLRLVLKQTMGMYSTACKEAVREKKEVYDAEVNYGRMDLIFVILFNIFHTTYLHLTCHNSA